jgi:WD40 repeat protein
MRAMYVLGGLLIAGSLGCDRLLDLLHDHGDGDEGGAAGHTASDGGAGKTGAGGAMAGAGGAGAMAGTGGAGAMAGAGGAGAMAGTGGAMGGGAMGGGAMGGAMGGSAGGMGVAACGALSFSQTIALGPSASDQAYVRCQTLGPETAAGVTLSPIGDRVALRTGAGTVRLLTTNPWHELVQIGSALGQIDAVAFSPDGATLAALSAEMGEVTLWNAADGTLARTFIGPAASGVDTTASALVFSSDGSRLATSLGTVIDLPAGTQTSWSTGAPLTAMLGDNPENLSPSSLVGGGIPFMQFSAGDAQLFLETDFQVGNSPTSTRLELRAPATGAQIVLYSFFSRGLLGYAVSPDGRFIARATTAEAGMQGFAPGLTIFDATTGAELANDPSFAGTVLGFSRDGSELFTKAGTAVTASTSADLQVAAQFAAPMGFAFLGVSPAGDLVGAVSDTTSWLDPATGAVVRTFDYPLGPITWSGDGRFGAGTGDPATLFHFWREADGTQLCGPAADASTAPTLASLGTAGPAGESQSVMSTDGSLTVTSTFVIHAHAANYDALSVTDTASGTLLRQFGAMIGTGPIAISSPSGAQLYTPQGPDVAVWCR